MPRKLPRHVDLEMLTWRALVLARGGQLIGIPGACEEAPFVDVRLELDDHGTG